MRSSSASLRLGTGRDGKGDDDSGRNRMLRVRGQLVMSDREAVRVKMLRRIIMTVMVSVLELRRRGTSFQEQKD